MSGNNLGLGAIINTLKNQGIVAVAIRSAVPVSPGFEYPMFEAVNRELKSTDFFKKIITSTDGPDTVVVVACAAELKRALKNPDVRQAFSNYRYALLKPPYRPDIGEDVKLLRHGPANNVRALELRL